MKPQIIEADKLAERHFWLAVESPHNWQVDAKNGFTFFGVSKKTVNRARRIRKSDVLIFYVGGGVSSFSGVRIAESDSLANIERGTDYDILCPAAIRTSPFVSLPRDSWVKIHPLVRRLKLFRGDQNWGNHLRRALIPLEMEDVALLVRTLRDHAPNAKWEQVLPEPLKRTGKRQGHLLKTKRRANSVRR